jgi:hypothetical protein
MTEPSSEVRAAIVYYQQVVHSYEALDERIDALLASYGGNVDQMSDTDKQHYREMARQRDELQNELRILEHDLLDADEL